MKELRILLILLFTGIPGVTAQAPDPGKLCKAIYFAEGGAQTRHPYGIMTKFKHTSPHQACLNTVRHKYSDWQKSGSNSQFLTYLASKYCPVSSDTDNGTCQYWENNVRRLYANSIQNKGMGNV